MATFRATVRIDNLGGEDAAEARRAVEERLREAGFQRCSVLRVDRQSALTETEMRRNRSRVAPGEQAWRRQSNTGGVLLAAAAIWALWFFWQLSSYLE
jgi:hypothetical protein